MHCIPPPKYIRWQNDYTMPCMLTDWVFLYKMFSPNKYFSHDVLTMTDQQPLTSWPTGKKAGRMSPPPTHTHIV
jgi:hypothetical protein